MTEATHNEIFAAAFGPWGQIGAAWAESLSGLGAEAMRFLAERVAADVELQRRLLTATSIEDLRHVQAEFLQRAIDQYVAETGRMVEIGEKLGRSLGLPSES